MAKNRCKDTNNLFGGGVESLEAGNVPGEYLALLFKFLKAADGSVRDAVSDHLCNGVLQSTAAENHDVKQGSISRQVKRLQDVNGIVCELAEYHR